MQLLHIIDSLGRGGAETLLVNTVLEFHEKYPEIKQHVVTLYDGGELYSEIAGKAEYYCLHFKLKNPFPAVLKLRRYLKKHRVEMVHSHLLHATFVARLALPAKAGLVSTYHTVFYEPTMVTYAGKELLFDKFTYRSRYYSIFVSEAVQENILKTIGIRKNYRVLLNFASPKFKTSYQFNPVRELRMVMVGNLHEIKNHEIAIKAMAQFCDLPVYLDIYGEGPLRNELQDLIAATAVKVTLHGKGNHVFGILKPVRPVCNDFSPRRHAVVVAGSFANRPAGSAERYFHAERNSRYGRGLLRLRFAGSAGRKDQVYF